MRTDFDLTEFSSIQSCFPHLNGVGFLQECSALFIFSLQWKFNCCYFSCNNTGLALNILERTSLLE